MWIICSVKNYVWRKLFREKQYKIFLKNNTRYSWKTIQDIPEKHETNYSTVTDVNDISDQTELTDLYNNSNWTNRSI